MGEIIFHFDREPIDKKIRVDYKWENQLRRKKNI